MKKMIKGLLVIAALSSTMVSGAGRNDRVHHDSVILHNALVKSMNTGKTIAAKLNAGSVTRQTASIAIRKINKGNPFRLLKFSTTGFKARWYENGKRKNVSVTLNGKGHH